MRRWLVCVLIATLALIVPPASGAVAAGRDAIGDSVMLGARDQLRARGFRVDAVVSRQFADALTIVRRRARDGSLRQRVVIHLGTNGILIDPDDCDGIARAATRDRHVYLVTISIARAYRETQNDRMRACAARHANTSVIDWAAYSKGHGGWFTSDGYHLSSLGRQRYAAYLDTRTS